MKFEKYFQPDYPINFYSAHPDLETAHKYVDEFYTVHCPLLEYIEIDRDSSHPHEDLSELWNEQTDGLKIGRKLMVRCFPDYDEEEKQTHRKHGTEIERSCRFSFGVLELKKNDLYPEMGDHMMFGGYEYELMRVYIKPTDLWQHTNQPLHISADAVIYRPGDKKFTKNNNKRL